MEKPALIPRRTTRSAQPAQLPATVELGAVADELREQPTGFAFFQAVRLLERLFPERRAVGGFGDPRDEMVRFAATTSSAFPASEIQSLTDDPDGGPPRLTVNFLGLTGPSGVLPAEYTSHLIARSRQRDYAMRDFLDIYNHRLLSLFYRAWEKYRFTVAHERDGDDALGRRLADLIGLALPSSRGRLAVDDRVLLTYGALLAPHRHSAVALEQLLSDAFGVPVSVEQFVGGWFPLDESAQCALDDRNGFGNGLGDASSQLGVGAVVGDEVWDQQSRARLRIGPMSREQYAAFLPGGADHARLRDLARAFSGGEVEFEAQLVLSRDAVPPVELGGDDVSLGWGSWLATRPLDRDPDETILTL